MSASVLFYKEFRHPSSQEWVVFVHGAGGSSTLWFKQLKAFKKHFNLLLIDLRGHGQSARFIEKIISSKYTFKSVTDDVIEVLDHLKIQSAHFVGMSLGTIVIRNLADMAKERVKTMVLGGAVTRLNFKSRFLFTLGNIVRNVVPYLWLYKLFARIVMPQKRARESRHLFVREAKKVCQNEFKRWFQLIAREVTPLMKCLREKPLSIPTLYIMGQDDYLFVEPVKELVKNDHASTLVTLKDCGHVCNIEAPDLFNQTSIDFIKKNS